MSNSTNQPIIVKRFGVKLRRLRTLCGLTQLNLADRCGLDRSFISDIERGRKSPTLTTLSILARELGITVNELTRHIDD